MGDWVGMDIDMSIYMGIGTDLSSDLAEMRMLRVDHVLRHMIIRFELHQRDDEIAQALLVEIPALSWA